MAVVAQKTHLYNVNAVILMPCPRDSLARIMHPRNRNGMVLWAPLCTLLCEHVARNLFPLCWFTVILVMPLSEFITHLHILPASISIRSICNSIYCFWFNRIISMVIKDALNGFWMPTAISIDSETIITFGKHKTISHECDFAHK